MLVARSLAKTAVRTKSDLISEIFVKQVRDLTQKQKSAGGLVNSSPEIKKQLEEQLNRLAQKFKLPNSDVVGKLDVQFEKPQVESSVNMILEGKNLDQLIAEQENNYNSYVTERDAKRKAEQKRLAAMAEAK
ncbi:ATP synthase-coupling factor 6, mitochondrial [Aphelenchoides besseyi]|nr:ATP synthase-coupling factor 6, mitochondrial [Aphelenchoides besseyi]KAI6199301.1 ATP synthase-coupling factor 6, mitochondrial [Aphelenchoides besseyi]